MIRPSVISKHEHRVRRHRRVRTRVRGSVERPRLSVYRSLNHIYAQLIDDQNGHTLAAASDREVKTPVKIEGRTRRVAVSFAVGELIAARAKEKHIERVVFDRGGFRFHGRVAALAAGARKGGLNF